MKFTIDNTEREKVKTNLANIKTLRYFSSVNQYGHEMMGFKGLDDRVYYLWCSAFTEECEYNVSYEAGSTLSFYDVKYLNIIEVKAKLA